MLCEISEAIKEMDKVADYINEMQRIHDSYSPLFIKLMSQSQDEKVILVFIYHMRSSYNCTS